MHDVGRSAYWAHMCNNGRYVRMNGSACLLLCDFPFVSLMMIVCVCYVVRCDASLSVLCQWRVYDTTSITVTDITANDRDVFVYGCAVFFLPVFSST